MAAPPEPSFNVERFIETCPPTGLGELYRLSIRDEELSERTVRPQLWRVLRQSYLIVFDDDRWSIRPELADALRKATNGDPMLGLRILWVDDRPANNRSVIRTLNARTVIVVEAKSTKEAMARSDLGGYDLIICYSN